MNNPFHLQTDNKKFFTEVAASINSDGDIVQMKSVTDNSNRIRNMNQELEALAKKREQMMFKEQQLNYIFKKQKNNNTGNLQGQYNDKKFRVRSLLKQKRESVNEFLNKKKQIYLAHMNINIKKEQTRKLAQSIRDQEETLKARQLYFQNDVQFMQKFIHGIKKQAEQAQNSVELELKQQEQLVSRINGLQAEIEKMDNLISKNTQILDSLQLYKNFIEGFYDQDRKWKPYTPKNPNNQDVLFMTQGGANLSNGDQKENMGFVIQYQPQNMLSLFVDAQEANIREIQNLQDKEEELDNITTSEKQQKSTLESVIIQNQQKIAQLQKVCAKKQQQCQQFKAMARSNNNKISIIENESLDIDKLSVKMYQIYKEINPKRAEQLEIVDKVSEMKRQAAELQQQIEKIRFSITYSKQNYSHLLSEVEKDFKNNTKRQNVQRKIQENRMQEIKKQQEQQKKRNQITNTKSKGRKDMEKVFLKKKVKKHNKESGEKGDDDMKYLEEEED